MPAAFVYENDLFSVHSFIQSRYISQSNLTHSEQQVLSFDSESCHRKRCPVSFMRPKRTFLQYGESTVVATTVHFMFAWKLVLCEHFVASVICLARTLSQLLSVHAMRILQLCACMTVSGGNHRCDRSLPSPSIVLCKCKPVLDIACADALLYSVQA